MKKILIFVAIFSLAIYIAYAVPSFISEFNVKYIGKEVADDRFYSSILKCINQTTEFKNSFNKTQLDISEFDSKNNCWWKNINIDDECEKSKCKALFLSPQDNFRLAIFIPSINKTFISSEIISPSNIPAEYNVDIKSDDTVNVKQTGGSSDFWNSIIFTTLIWIVSIFSFMKLTESFSQNRKRILLSLILSIFLSVLVVQTRSIISIIGLIPYLNNNPAVLLSTIPLVLGTVLTKLLNKEILSWKRSALLGVVALLFSLGFLFLLSSIFVVV